MIRSLITLLTLTSILIGQSYRWPIRASQSLSATFAEYRSGHLHAGVDIKTWGEMEVPCLAIADGYIEHIAVGYNGYGRGLWLRLNDGNVAVYGHLEQFNPVIENLIRSEQQSQEKYSVRLKFTPDEFPVKAGSIIGYSGTSGTEHPHLHFEIRDSLNHLFNPQLFYSGIRDVKAPVFDEVKLIPQHPQTRINGSQFPVVFDWGEEIKRVSTTGPFLIAINAHDRANGTYNKYNIYRAEVFVNDSLMFERHFNDVQRKLTDDIDKIYPGSRGKRGWRFMSLYNLDTSAASPFAPDNLNGLITPAGLSDLSIKLSDIKGNTVSKNLIFHEQVLAQWELERKDGNIIVTRYFPENGYENIQFYSGENTYIPVSETLYRLSSTSWIFEDQNLRAGVRALGSAGGQIKWVVPPEIQDTPEFTYQWRPKQKGWVLRIESSFPFVFPIAFSLEAEEQLTTGELVQISPTSVESNVIPIETGAVAERVLLLSGSEVINSLQLNPMTSLAPSQTQRMKLDIPEIELVAKNQGDSEIFVHMDTTTASFNNEPILGVTVHVVNAGDSSFSGRLTFLDENKNTDLAIYSPGKKKTWKRQTPVDSTQNLTLDIQQGGKFFLLQDTAPPVVRPKKSYSQVRRGDRLVFGISENTKVLKYPRRGIRGTLDGSPFFPDFNPLRQELSFHVPRRIGSGQHLFEFSIEDGSGNVTDFRHVFIVKS